MPPKPPECISAGGPPATGPNKHGRTIVFDMRHYADDCVKKYCDLVGVERSSLKKATTPFCPEGSLPAADDEVSGQLGGFACANVMKSLWLARLARPELQKAIGDLASNVTKWTKNDDRKLLRLVSHINHTLNSCLVGYIKDPPELLKLLLFVDADLCGSTDTTRSTSGSLLVLAGPNSWFPIAWISKKQTASSRSTYRIRSCCVGAGPLHRRYTLP